MNPGDRLVVMDLETGGLDHQRHPVIQFAAIAVDHEWRELDALELKVLFDEASAEPVALGLNGYDSDVWKRDGLLPDVARARIAAFLRRHATIEKKAKAGALQRAFATSSWRVVEAMSREQLALGLVELMRDLGGRTKEDDFAEEAAEREAAEMVGAGAGRAPGVD